VRATLASIVLATEFLVVLLAAAALGGGAALLVLIGIAARLASSPVGIALGWLVQLVLLATGAVQIAVGIVGLLFGAFWLYCMIVGGRIDRRNAGARGPAREEQA
jgi:hypothetical protein